MYTIISGFELCLRAVADAPPPPMEADAEFEPTLTNTLLFLLSSFMLLTTFAANYTGHPFMASIYSNRGLMATLTLSAAVLTVLTAGYAPGLAAYLELLPLPDEVLGDHDARAGGAPAGAGIEVVSVRSELLSLMALDFVLCVAIERSVARLFRY
jgi:hypothetical protein